MFATRLLADDAGPHTCFYCGLPCSGELATKQYVASTFNDWATVGCPNSDRVCRGCMVALDEKLLLPGKDRPQKTRNYSWLTMASDRQHFSKADIAALRGICLDPPLPPWALTIATSGQRHLLYKTPVNMSAGPEWTVLLENERVTYRPDDLTQRLALLLPIVAAVGKIAPAAGPLELSHVMAIEQLVGESATELAAAWEAVRDEPLSRLALFLSPNREDSLDEYRATAHPGR